MALARRPIVRPYEAPEPPVVRPYEAPEPHGLQRMTPRPTPRPLPIISADRDPRRGDDRRRVDSSPGPGPIVQVPPGVPPPPGPLTLEQAERQQLINLLSQDPSSVSLSDPMLQGQANAFAVGQTRQADRARNMLAERRAAQGLGSSGAFDADLNNLSQQQGEAESGFNASLVANELAARRQQIVQALTIGGGMLSEEDRNRANLQIARIDAEARKYGIDMQGKLGTGQLNLGLLQTLMGNQQFNDSLGWDMSKFQWNANDPFSAFR